MHLEEAKSVNVTGVAVISVILAVNFLIILIGSAIFCVDILKTCFNKKIGKQIVNKKGCKPRPFDLHRNRCKYVHATLF